MRHDGVWHPRLAQVIAALGHGDLLVVADPGLPVPRGVEAIDLVFARGEPAFVPVLRVVAAELVVEAAHLAHELTDEKLVAAIDGSLGPVPLHRISHETLKSMTARATAVVRTGEDTPYANIVLRAGVPF